MAGQHRKPEHHVTQRQFSELPPRPDPHTGEPIPPQAPAYAGPDRGDEPSFNQFFGTPTPPPGMGPVLAWRHEGIRDKIRGYFVAFLIMVVGSALVSLWRGSGLDVLTMWPIWVIIVIFAYLMSRPLDFATMAAGADWLQWGRRKRWYQRRAYRGHIKTYELVSISADASGPTIYLRLEDAEGHVLYRMRHDLQPNRRIWDLLYNGILHSVANGAEIDDLAIDLLNLDQTPALRLRDSHQDEPATKPDPPAAGTP